MECTHTQYTLHQGRGVREYSNTDAGNTPVPTILKDILTVQILYCMNDIKVNLDKADNLYETDIKFKML